MVPLSSGGLIQTDTVSNPSKYGGSIAPLSKKFAEITVPVILLMTIGVPLEFGSLVPMASNLHSSPGKAAALVGSSDCEQAAKKIRKTAQQLERLRFLCFFRYSKWIDLVDGRQFD